MFRIVIWAWHVARIWGNGNEYRVLMRNPQKKEIAKKSYT
jgi:hypothetical protein